MKYTTLILLLFIYAQAVYAGAPPQAVKDAFTQKFPAARDVKWGKENKNEWEAEFVSNGTKTSVNFSNDGKWVETETEIAVSELPAAVKAAIEKEHNGYSITEADRIERATGILYEVDLKSGMKKKEVHYSAEGAAVH
ncbi:MAG TPA: PepSY-like domain-containing protein [Bacteroidia bacterium]|nr:PepSY-like domain-containing protein [Bacteroidia bacterium]